MLGVWEYFFSTVNWNTTFVPSTGTPFNSSDWAVWGLVGIWSTMPQSQSTAAPPTPAANRKLISPTGFILFNTISRL